MALLEASNIKKIYTTDDNIAVGISDINLMLDKNEVVAITGGSGSGKSTLLRVLGGLESYEEGELYFKGLPTSHYTQEDWAEYLNTNISFIFQEYNILESFTVLENVMYALTDIKSKKERKKRAKEIIERVGLKDRMKAKGAQLSGGEKQRTVIARAIAKDSPIILADEPTGNLDSNTAHAIIDLLQEISKDKLVVIVTHNYEDVKRITTRHIRLFDGKIELDEGGDNVEHVSSMKQNPFDFKEEREVIFKKENKKQGKGGYPKDGIALGLRRVTSRPKQNILTIFLLIVASLLIFVTCVAMIPSNVGQGSIVKQPGRVLLVAKDGEYFDNYKIEDFKKEFNAKDAILYDSALDAIFFEGTSYPAPYEQKKKTKFKLGYDLNFALDEGEQIKAPGEVVLKVPYTLKGKYKIGSDLVICGKYVNPSENNEGGYGGMENTFDSSIVENKAKIVGLTYYLGAGLVYVDMHKQDAQAVSFKLKNQIKLSAVINSQYGDMGYIFNAFVDDSLTGNEAKVLLSRNFSGGDNDNLSLSYLGFGNESNTKNIYMLDPVNVTVKKIKYMTDEEGQKYGWETNYIFVSRDFFNSTIVSRAMKDGASRQISLYFDTSEQAKAASDKISEKDENNYMTFLASEYKAGKQKLGLPVVVALIVAVVISLVIVLSLVKIFAASKADVSIYRTMGISNSVIKGSTFVQVLMDMIPSLFVLVGAYVLCFFTALGEKLNFMPITGLIALAIAVVGMSMIVAIGFNRVIYKEKINKGLRRTNK